MSDRSCEGMFRCANGQCISREFVCDKFQSEDCRDGSDERDCGRIKYGDDESDSGKLKFFLRYVIAGVCPSVCL